MFTNDADQPVTDKDLQAELTKTGYLIQAAYSYLKVYQDNNATIGLPMVKLAPMLCQCALSSMCQMHSCALHSSRSDIVKVLQRVKGAGREGNAMVYVHTGDMPARKSL